MAYTHHVLPPNVLEAPAGEDVEQEEDGADDVQVEHGLVYTHPVLPPNVLEAPAARRKTSMRMLSRRKRGLMMCR
jgi:hypothetical protein